MAIDKSTRPAAPPRKSAVTTSKPTGSDSKHRKRKEGLQSVQQAAGLALIAAKQPADAAAVGMHGDAIIDELVTLADSEESIAKALDYLTKTGPYSALVMATLPLMMQLAVNHGRMKPNAMMPNVVSKETLDAQYRADMAKVEMAARKAEREAKDQLREMEDQIARQNGGFQNDQVPPHSFLSDMAAE
jgi:hypothetical protein